MHIGKRGRLAASTVLASQSLEVRSGGAPEQRTLDEIIREVRGFGDNVRGLKESMERDLASVRSLAEGAKGAIGPEVRAQIEALTASVAEKHGALEDTVKSRLSAIEMKLNRGGLGAGGGTEGEAVERRQAMEFHRMSLAARGQLKASQPVKDEDVDLDGIRSWNAAFPRYLRVSDSRAIEERALSVGSDPDGGYFVPTQVSARIITQVFETSPMRQVATVENISTDALEIPNDLGEFDAGWVGEQEDRPETATSKVGVLRIPAHEMYASPKATQKLLEDASIDIAAWMARKVADKFGRMESGAFVVGNGIKKPRGFLTYAAGNDLTKQQIEQVNTGAATAVTADSLVGLMISLKEPYAAAAVWMMRRASVGSVMLLKDNQGQYIWRPGLEAGKPSILLGSPVMQAADMPVIAAGALPIAFGDFGQGYTIVDRLGISTLRDPFTAKPFVTFYTRRRVGGDVTNFEAIKLLKVST